MTALAIEPNTTEWLEERKKHIGASDAPAIIGLTTSWRNARDVALEKMSDEIDNSDPHGFFHRGHVLEPLIKELYKDKTGFDVFQASMYVHEDYEWMSATPDGWVINTEGKCLLECKTANNYMKHEWKDIDDDGNEFDIVPTKYWVQVQHQMAVTDEEQVDVAVLFAGIDTLGLFVSMLDTGADLMYVKHLCQNMGGEPFKIIEVKRDDEFIEKLISIEKDFWENIEKGILPEDIKFTPDSGMLRVANYEEECFIIDLKTAYLQKLLAEEDFEECARKVKEAIGEDTGIYSDSLGKITYRLVAPRKKTDWKALAEEILDKKYSKDDQQLIIDRFTSTGKALRRFSFPFKSWKMD